MHERDLLTGQAYLYQWRGTPEQSCAPERRPRVWGSGGSYLYLYRATTSAYARRVCMDVWYAGTATAGAGGSGN